MGLSFSKSCLIILSTTEYGTENSWDRRDEGAEERWESRAADRELEREEEDRKTSW